MTTTQTTVTADEMFMSLTGYDEIAIAKEFGRDVTELRNQPFMFLRALAFVVHRRNGDKDPAAYKAAMEAAVTDLNDFFPDPPTDEADPLAEDADPEAPRPSE